MTLMGCKLASYGMDMSAANFAAWRLQLPASDSMPSPPLQPDSKIFNSDRSQTTTTPLPPPRPQWSRSNAVSPRPSVGNLFQLFRQRHTGREVSQE